jgi:predicted signal transduction protein with EAL and GGDEF domain
MPTEVKVSVNPIPGSVRETQNRRLGVSIVLDDFGVGYPTLSDRGR